MQIRKMKTELLFDKNSKAKHTTSKMLISNERGKSCNYVDYWYSYILEQWFIEVRFEFKRNKHEMQIKTNKQTCTHTQRSTDTKSVRDRHLELLLWCWKFLNTYWKSQSFYNLNLKCFRFWCSRVDRLLILHFVMDFKRFSEKNLCFFMVIKLEFFFFLISFIVLQMINVRKSLNYKLSFDIS